MGALMWTLPELRSPPSLSRETTERPWAFAKREFLSSSLETTAQLSWVLAKREPSPSTSEALATMILSWLQEVLFPLLWRHGLGSLEGAWVSSKSEVEVDSSPATPSWSTLSKPTSTKTPPQRPNPHRRKKTIQFQTSFLKEIYEKQS